MCPLPRFLPLTQGWLDAAGIGIYPRMDGQTDSIALVGGFWIMLAMLLENALFSSPAKWRLQRQPSGLALSQRGVGSSTDL